MALAILFFILTIKNSVGNITEIVSLLDKDIYNGQELEEHYGYLVEKYGEWSFDSQGGSFSIRFVNIASALFSGLMKTFLILTILCLMVGIIVGKAVFPKLSQYYSTNNQDMVNMATLQTNAELVKKRAPAEPKITKPIKTDKGRWF